MSLRAEEITFHPASYCDSNGRLFTWKGELYRGIRPKATALCERLFVQGITTRLIEKGLLVETQLTDLTLDEYPLILKHQRVPFVSYPYEWCFDQLKDAALLVVDLELELTKHGLTVDDPDSWNLLFNGALPVYVDFCAIRPDGQSIGPPRIGGENFTRKFLYPLHLMTHGHGHIARWLLHDREEGVLHADFAALVGSRALCWQHRHVVKGVTAAVKRRLPRKLLSAVERGRDLLTSTTESHTLQGPATRVRFLQRLRQEIEQCSLPLEEYPSRFSAFSLAPSHTWEAKQCAIHQLIEAFRPASVLHIGGGNEAWYSQLAAHMSCKTVTLDTDETSVRRLYRRARSANLSILPLVMDVRFPSPGCGLGNQELAPALQRLKCEMVLALGIVSQLVFEGSLRFDQIAETVSAFTTKYALIEFIPLAQAMPSDRYPVEKYCWYTLENLKAALERLFRNVSHHTTCPDSHTLLLCER